MICTFTKKLLGLKFHFKYIVEFYFQTCLKVKDGRQCLQSSDFLRIEIFRQSLHYSALAKLLQLNRTQFSSLGIFICKKVGNPKKTKTTFITSVLKVIYLVVLVFSISNFFINKNSRGRKLNAKKIPSSGNSAFS